MICPSDHLLRKFLEDELSAEDEWPLAEHIESCDRCQRVLEQMTGGGEANRRADPKEPRPQITPSDAPSHAGDARSATRLSDHQLSALTPLLPSPNGEESPADLATHVRDSSWPRFAGYEVEAEIGQGGMGTVYRARDLRLGRLVAIKRLRQSEIESPDELIRFRTESQTIAHLDHPNIVRLLEIGSHDEAPYCVLEYVDGGSLESRLTGAPWSPYNAASLIEAIASAIAYSHERGVVHRDLKPGNILLPRDEHGAPVLESAKVADFGLAKQIHSDLSLTMTGTLAGTPSYMAPEQIRGEKDRIGPATDVYALGGVLYELLTGRVPFSGVTELEVMNQILEQEPLPPSRLVPRVPRDLESICLQCLEKEPARRYPSAGALANDLNAFRRGRPVSARASGVLDRGWKWTRRKPTLAALLVTILLVATVGFPAITFMWFDAASSRDRAQRSERAQRWAHYRANMAAAGSLLQLHNADAARRALDAAPKEHRNWEWRHFRQRIEATRMILAGHDGVVWNATFSPDGNRVASISADGTMRLWNTRSGATVRVLSAHQNTDRRAKACFSRDGRLLAAPGPGRTIQLCEAQTGQPLGTLSGHGADVAEVVFSPDGQTLLSRPILGDDKTIRAWDIRTHSPTKVWDLELPAFWIAFSPDGNAIAATMANGMVRLWHEGVDRLVAHDRHLDTMVTAAAFSPDSRRLVTSLGEYAEFVTRVSNVSDGRQIAALRGHNNAVNAIRFSPDGSVIASASADQTIRLWDAEDGDALDVLVGHRGPVTDVRFSPDGRTLATASRDHTVRVWDASNGALQDVLFGHSDGVNSLEFDRSGSRIVTASSDGTVGVWDLSTLSRTNVIGGHTSYVYDVAISPDEQTAASASWDGTFRIWNVSTGEELMRLESRAPRIATSLAYGPGGKRLATLERGALRLWDVATGECLQQVEVTRSPPDGRIAFSRDGTLIVAGVSGGEIYWWEGPGERVTRTAAHPGGCRDVSLSRDSKRLVSTGENGIALVWDVATKRQIAELRGHRRQVTSVAFSVDGTLVATGSEDGSVRLWDANRYTPSAVLEHGAKVYDVAFHPDGERLAVACADNSIRIWDVATGDHVADLRGHDAYVHALEFSGDGKQLLSASGDGTVRVWVAE